MIKDIFSRPLIIIRSHNLHVDDIRRTMGETTSYHEREGLTLSLLWFLWALHLLAFLWPSFLFFVWWFHPSTFIDFLFLFREFFKDYIFFAWWNIWARLTTQLTDCLFSFKKNAEYDNYQIWGGGVLFPLPLSIASVSNGPDHSPCPTYPPLWLKSPWNGSSSQPSDSPPLSFNPTVVTIPVFWKVGTVLLCSAAENWPGRDGSGRVVDVVFHSSACVSRPGARAAQKKIIKWAAATPTFSFWSCFFLLCSLSRSCPPSLLSLSPLLFLFSAVCMLFPCLSSSSSVSFSLLSLAT